MSQHINIEKIPMRARNPTCTTEKSNLEDDILIQTRIAGPISGTYEEFQKTEESQVRTATLVVVSFLSVSKSPWKRGQSHWTERWKASETVYNETGSQDVGENLKIHADGADHGSTKTCVFLSAWKSRWSGSASEWPKQRKMPHSRGCHYKRRRRIWADEGVAAVPGEAGGKGEGWNCSDLLTLMMDPQGLASSVGPRAQEKMLGGE